MEQHNAIRNLMLHMSNKHIIGLGVVAVLAVCGTVGYFGNSKSVIVVDGKPVVCVSTQKDASDILHNIKSNASRNTSEVQFKQDVVVRRAPRDARPVSRYRAARVLQRIVCPVFPRWAVIVDGKPAVALPTQEMAGEVLDLAKMKYGSQVKNLLEEPQFKENVTVDMVPVEPSIYCTSAKQAVNFLFAETAPVVTDSTYTVANGDIAGSIARAHRLSLHELAMINPGINLDRLSIGDKLHVKAAAKQKPKLTVVVRDMSERTEKIPMQVQRISSAALYSGKTLGISSGKAGLKKVKVATIYENGKKTGSETLDEEILHEAEPKRIAVGIKPVPTWK